MQIFLGGTSSCKKKKTGLGPNRILLRFEGDLGHPLDTKI